MFSQNGIQYFQFTPRIQNLVAGCNFHLIRLEICLLVLACMLVRVLLFAMAPEATHKTLATTPVIMLTMMPLLILARTLDMNFQAFIFQIRTKKIIL